MIKNIRYFYWIFIEFFKKHQKILLITFLLTFVFVTFLVSSIPVKFFLTKKQRVGLVGQYSVNNPPDEIITLISNPFLYHDEKGNYQPILISSWEAMDNDKKFRITLKDNILWNDGKKFVADDVNLKIKDVEIKKIDARNIFFILKQPLPIFLNYLTKPLLRNGLVGVAGAYAAANIKIKNGYLSEVYLQPRITGLPPIIYRFYGNEEKMIQAYKRGEINKMIVKKKSLADNFLSWRNTKITRMVDYKHPAILFFNLNDKKLEDRELRSSIIKAIDKSEFNDKGEAAYGPITPISNYFAQNSNLDIYSPELSQSYIKSHYTSTNSAEIKFSLVTSYDFFDVVGKIKEQFNKVGVGVETKITNRIPTEDYQLFLTYWTNPILDDQYYFWHSSQVQANLSNYKNVKIDKILEEIRSTRDFFAKKKLAVEFQKAFADDPPAAFLYYPYNYLIERK
jgi:peptide/nickel transport system substrate-binding protein